MLVRIEQRLQDPPRFLILPADEAIVVGVPVMMGLLSRQAIVGIVVSLVGWVIWRKLKGEGGLERVLAALYWFLPTNLSGFSALADSSVTHWEG